MERETNFLMAGGERARNASVNTDSTAEATSGSPSDAIRDSVREDALAAGRQYALDVAYRVLEQAARTTLRTYRFARSADAP